VHLVVLNTHLSRGDPSSSRKQPQVDVGGSLVEGGFRFFATSQTFPPPAKCCCRPCNSKNAPFVGTYPELHAWPKMCITLSTLDHNISPNPFPIFTKHWCMARKSNQILIPDWTNFHCPGATLVVGSSNLILGTCLGALVSKHPWEPQQKHIRYHPSR